MMALQPADALDLEFDDPDIWPRQKTTIRDYFKKQLSTLWAEGESFSGKRPFGNSGWEGCLEAVLIQHHCIPGAVEIDEDGDLSVFEVDDRAYQAFVQKMIEALQ